MLSPDKTNKEVILDILSDGKWHCSKEFYKTERIADPRTILAQLLKRGIVEPSKPCDNSYHEHRSMMKMWKLRDDNSPTPSAIRKEPESDFMKQWREEFMEKKLEPIKETNNQLTLNI
jgi:hypothetical protein